MGRLRCNEPPPDQKVSPSNVMRFLFEKKKQEDGASGIVCTKFRLQTPKNKAFPYALRWWLVVSHE